MEQEEDEQKGLTAGRQVASDEVPCSGFMFRFHVQVSGSGSRFRFQVQVPGSGFIFGLAKGGMMSAMVSASRCSMKPLVQSVQRSRAAIVCMCATLDEGGVETGAGWWSGREKPRIGG